MNFNEIKDKLEYLNVTPQQLAQQEFVDWDELPADTDYSDAEKKRLQEIIDAVGPFKQVAHYGGEGKGEEWYSVIFFEAHDVYIRIDAWYASYDGTDFSGSEFKEVRPQQKTITIYE